MLRASSPVKVSQLLDESLILIAGGASDKARLIESLVARVCEKNVLPDPQTFLGKVLEREQGISTTLDTGLSLPHARMDNLPGLVAGLAIVPQGVPDPKQPGLAIRVMFLFFSPNKPEAFPLHLQLLRSVATLFAPPLIERLARASSGVEALEILRSQEAA